MPMKTSSAPIEISWKEFTDSHTLKGGCRQCKAYATVMPVHRKSDMRIMRETECVKCGQLYVIVDSVNWNATLKKQGFQFSSAEPDDLVEGEEWKS